MATDQKVIISTIESVNGTRYILTDAATGIIIDNTRVTDSRPRKQLLDTPPLKGG